MPIQICRYRIHLPLLVWLCENKAKVRADRSPWAFNNWWLPQEYITRGKSLPLNLKKMGSMGLPWIKFGVIKSLRDLVSSLIYWYFAGTETFFSSLNYFFANLRTCFEVLPSKYTSRSRNHVTYPTFMNFFAFSLISKNNFLSLYKLLTMRENL